MVGPVLDHARLASGSWSWLPKVLGCESAEVEDAELVEFRTGHNVQVVQDTLALQSVVVCLQDHASVLVARRQLALDLRPLPCLPVSDDDIGLSRAAVGLDREPISEGVAEELLLHSREQRIAPPEVVEQVHSVALEQRLGLMVELGHLPDSVDRCVSVNWDQTGLRVFKVYTECDRFTPKPGELIGRCLDLLSNVIRDLLTRLSSLLQRI